MAVNRIERVATIAEVKINRTKISIPVLEEKAKKVISELKRYHIEYKVTILFSALTRIATQRIFAP